MKLFVPGGVQSARFIFVHVTIIIKYLNEAPWGLHTACINFLFQMFLIQRGVFDYFFVNHDARTSTKWIMLLQNVVDILNITVHHCFLRIFKRLSWYVPKHHGNFLTYYRCSKSRRNMDGMGIHNSFFISWPYSRREKRTWYGVRDCAQNISHPS